MRCCYRPSLAAAATALLLACASSAVTTVAGDRVLVVGAQKDLVHDAIAADSNPSSLATTFTPAGLAGLAMDAFGLATGNLVRLSSGGGDSAETASQIAVSSPAQADVFSRVDAYAVVLVDRADAAVVDGVDAASTAGYHKVFELQEHAASAKIPKVIATELSKTAPTAEIKCAGDDAVCGSSLFKTATVSEADVDRVFQAYSFLDRTVESDVVLAEQLAQTAQITSRIKSSNNKKSLVVVSFSGVNALDEGKREAARGAVRDHIQRLLAALQTAYPTSSGAQVVAAKHGAVRALDATIAYSRMLLSFKEGVVGSDDDDDDDDSGSSEGAGNATTSDVTMQDIAEYQIVLWTSVILGGVLLLVILAMCNMEPKRDSLLYAKFTTSNGGRKFD